MHVDPYKAFQVPDISEPLMFAAPAGHTSSVQLKFGKGLLYSGFFHLVIFLSFVFLNFFSTNSQLLEIEPIEVTLVDLPHRAEMPLGAQTKVASTTDVASTTQDIAKKDIATKEVATPPTPTPQVPIKEPVKPKTAKLEKALVLKEKNLQKPPTQEKILEETPEPAKQKNETPPEKELQDSKKLDQATARQKLSSSTVNKNTISKNIDAQSSPDSLATMGGTNPTFGVKSGKGKGLGAPYDQIILSLLTKNKNYPDRARRRHIMGDGLLKLNLNRSGLVKKFEIVKSTNSELLDLEIAQMVERASPFPPAPENYPGENLEFLIPISFKLEGVA